MKNHPNFNEAGHDLDNIIFRQPATMSSADPKVLKPAGQAHWRGSWCWWTEIWNCDCCRGAETERNLVGYDHIAKRGEP